MRCRSNDSASLAVHAYRIPVRLLWSVSVEELPDVDLIDLHLAFVCEASPQQEGLDEDLTVLQHVCASDAHLHRKSLQMQIY